MTENWVTQDFYKIFNKIKWTKLKTLKISSRIDNISVYLQENQDLFLKEFWKFAC